MKAWGSEKLNNFLKLLKERGKNPTCVSDSKGMAFLLFEDWKSSHKLRELVFQS